MPAAALLALALAVAPVDSPHVEALVFVPEPSSGRAALNLWLSVAALAPRGQIRLHARTDAMDLARYQHALGTPPELREVESLLESLRQLRAAIAHAPPGRRRLLYAVVLSPDSAQRARLADAFGLIAPDELHLFTDDPELAQSIARSPLPGSRLLCVASAERFAAAVAGVLSGVADADANGTVRIAEAGAWMARMCEPAEVRSGSAGDVAQPVVSSEGTAQLDFGEELSGEFVVQPVLAPVPWLAFAKARGAPISLRAPAAFFQVMRRGPDGSSSGAAFVLRRRELRTVTPARFNLSAQFPPAVSSGAPFTVEEVAEFEASQQEDRFAARLGAAAIAAEAARGGLELAASVLLTRFLAGVAADAAWGREGARSFGAELFGGPSMTVGMLRLAALVAAGAQLGGGAGTPPVAARLSAGPLVDLRVSRRFGIYARAQLGLLGASTLAAQAGVGGGVSFWW